MTYTVLGGALNSTQSNQCSTHMSELKYQMLVKIATFVQFDIMNDWRVFVSVYRWVRLRSRLEP